MSEPTYEELNPFVCERCGVRKPTQDLLDDHLENVHNIETASVLRNFKLCTFCGAEGESYVFPTGDIKYWDFCTECRVLYELDPSRQCRVCHASGRRVGDFDHRYWYACGAHVEQVEAQLADKLRQLHVHKTNRLREQAGWRVADYSFNSYPDDELGKRVVAQAEEWFEDCWGQNLVLYGDVGTGKTGLAYALASRFLDEYHKCETVEWVVVRKLLAEVKASFNGGPPVDRDFGSDCSLLVLDDLGAERVTEWTRDYLAGIIEARYDAEVPVIVTTNYPPSKLAARLGHDDVVIGQRLVSRLVENAVVVPFKGADRRKLKAA